MAAERAQKPIDHVFSELKAKGLIESTRKLRPKKADWKLDFGADRITNTICYNERHSHLEKNLLRFSLLHEEYHFLNRKNWTTLRLFYAMCVTVAVVSIRRCLDISALGFLLVVIVIMALALKVAFMVFRPRLRADETKADLHAARILIEEFGVERPSVVAQSLFKTLRETPRKRTMLMYHLRRLLVEDFHPSDTERVSAIQKFEDSLRRKH